jgi:hypothetical protein
MKDFYPTSDFILVHKTNVNRLEEIFKDGYLEPRVNSYGDEDGEPLIFLQIIFPGCKNAPDFNIINHDVYLYFDPCILDDMKNYYHFTPDMPFGRITEDTLHYKTFDTKTKEETLQLNLNYMLMKNNEYHNNFNSFMSVNFGVQNPNELVFTKRIDLKKYLKGIYFFIFDHHSEESFYGNNFEISLSDFDMSIKRMKERVPYMLNAYRKRAELIYDFPQYNKYYIKSGDERFSKFIQYTPYYN